MTEAELEAMWVHIAEAWTGLGSNEPLWSVLSDPRYLTKSRPTPDAVKDFYESGRGDRDYLLSFLGRAGIANNRFPVVAEYGCGVGRTTRWLAGSFDHIRAIDISTSHLAMARAHLAESDVTNVNFHHLAGRDGLSHLAGVDLFFSIIVLQHNPPPLILDILDRAFAGLNPGGVAFFQVPIYSIDYEFSVGPYLQKTASKKSMEGHFVPQVEIFKLACVFRRSRPVIPLELGHLVRTKPAGYSDSFRPGWRRPLTDSRLPLRRQGGQAEASAAVLFLRSESPLSLRR